MTAIFSWVYPLQKQIHSSCPSARPAHSNNIGFGQQSAANLLRIHFWLPLFRNVVKCNCNMLPYKSGHGPLLLSLLLPTKEGRTIKQLASLCCWSFLEGTKSFYKRQALDLMTLWQNEEEKIIVSQPLYHNVMKYDCTMLAALYKWSITNPCQRSKEGLKTTC